MRIFRKNHIVFWALSILWIAVVAVLWYRLFNNQISFLTIPKGESGYTFGYFLGALGVGAIALVLLGRRTHTLMEQVENDRLKIENDRAKMINETFAKSVELLGNSAVAVRQGGIFALQRLSRERDLYRTTIRILASFVRDQSRDFRVKRDKETQDQKSSTLPVDVEAALIVIRDRDAILGAEDWKALKTKDRNRTNFDLSNSFLLNTSLDSVDFRGFNLSDCIFEGCLFDSASFQDAILSSAVFTNSDLVAVNLTGAKLNGTDFSGCDLQSAIGLEQNQIESAIGNSFTKLPLNLKQPTLWTASPT